MNNTNKELFVILETALIKIKLTDDSIASISIYCYQIADAFMCIQMQRKNDKNPNKERIIFIHNNNAIKDIFCGFYCKIKYIVIPKTDLFARHFLSIGSSDANCPHNSISKGRKGSISEWLCE